MADSRDTLRAVWVARGFLDYRIPVYAELDKLCGGQMCLVYSADYVPQRVQDKARAILGERAIALGGEWKFGDESAVHLANRVISLRLNPKLPGVIRRLRPEALIGDGFFQWTSGALIQRVRRGTPLVVCYERTAHTERGAQWYRRAYRRGVMRFVDAMCCNGSLSAEYAATLGMSPERIGVGQMAADNEGIAAAAAAVTPQRRTELRDELGCRGAVLLYVGRMSPRKGVDYLLRAWARLYGEAAESSAPPATLLCVGDGEQLPELRALAAELGVQRSVVFTGAIDYDGIYEYYAAADGFVIPTLEDNWSLVVPEAMAAGLAILCSSYNGCWPELVRAGDNGWVFDPLRIDDAAAALSGFVSAGEQAWRAMGRRSREIVAEHTPARAAAAIYDSCLAAIEHARRTRKRLG